MKKVFEVEIKDGNFKKAVETIFRQKDGFIAEKLVEQKCIHTWKPKDEDKFFLELDYE